MPKLTDKQVRDFNVRVPGLGTYLQVLAAGGNSSRDYFDGLVNTGNVLIDNCDALNMNVADDNTKFKAVLDTVKYYKGTGSVKLEAITTGATGQKIYKVISSADWSGSTRIAFIAFSDIALSAGDLKLYIKDSVAGDQFVNVPAVAAGVPKYVEIDISGLTRTATIRYGFQCNKSAIFNVNIDQILRYSATNSVVLSNTPIIGDGVRISTMVKAATGAHTRTALVEDTDFAIIHDSKRVVFLTDQSANTCNCEYQV